MPFTLRVKMHDRTTCFPSRAVVTSATQKTQKSVFKNMN